MQRTSSFRNKDMKSPERDQYRVHFQEEYAEKMDNIAGVNPMRAKLMEKKAKSALKSSSGSGSDYSSSSDQDIPIKKAALSSADEASSDTAKKGSEETKKKDKTNAIKPPKKSDKKQAAVVSQSEGEEEKADLSEVEEMKEDAPPSSSSKKLKDKQKEKEKKKFQEHKDSKESANKTSLSAKASLNKTKSNKNKDTDEEQDDHKVVAGTTKSEKANKSSSSSSSSKEKQAQVQPQSGQHEETKKDVEQTPPAEFIHHHDSFDDEMTTDTLDEESRVYFHYFHLLDSIRGGHFMKLKKGIAGDSPALDSFPVFKTNKAWLIILWDAYLEQKDWMVLAFTDSHTAYQTIQQAGNNIDIIKSKALRYLPLHEISEVYLDPNHLVTNAFRMYRGREVTECIPMDKSPQVTCLWADAIFAALKLHSMVTSEELVTSYQKYLQFLKTHSLEPPKSFYPHVTSGEYSHQQQAALLQQQGGGGESSGFESDAMTATSNGSNNGLSPNKKSIFRKMKKMFSISSSNKKEEGGDVSSSAYDSAASMSPDERGNALRRATTTNMPYSPNYPGSGSGPPNVHNSPMGGMSGFLRRWKSSDTSFDKPPLSPKRSSSNNTGEGYRQDKQQPQQQQQDLSQQQAEQPTEGKADGANKRDNNKTNEDKDDQNKSLETTGNGSSNNNDPNSDRKPVVVVEHNIPKSPAAELGRATLLDKIFEESILPHHQQKRFHQQNRILYQPSHHQQQSSMMHQQHYHTQSPGAGLANVSVTNMNMASPIAAAYTPNEYLQALNNSNSNNVPASRHYRFPVEEEEEEDIHEAYLQYHRRFEELKNYRRKIDVTTTTSNGNTPIKTTPYSQYQLYKQQMQRQQESNSSVPAAMLLQDSAEEDAVLPASSKSRLTGPTGATSLVSALRRRQQQAEGIGGVSDKSNNRSGKTLQPPPPPPSSSSSQSKVIPSFELAYSLYPHDRMKDSAQKHTNMTPRSSDNSSSSAVAVTSTPSNVNRDKILGDFLLGKSPTWKVPPAPAAPTVTSTRTPPPPPPPPPPPVSASSSVPKTQSQPQQAPPASASSKTKEISLTSIEPSDKAASSTSPVKSPVSKPSLTTLTPTIATAVSTPVRAIVRNVDEVIPCSPDDCSSWRCRERIPFE